MKLLVNVSIAVGVGILCVRGIEYAHKGEKLYQSGYEGYFFVGIFMVCGYLLSIYEELKKRG